MYEIAHRGIAIEQGQELLCFFLRALTYDKWQPDHTGRDIRLEYSAIIGDDRYAPVLLPQRKRLAFLDADLQFAAIELEHSGVCDPRIRLEVVANLLEVANRHGGGAGDARGGEHFVAADVMIAAERTGHETKAGRVGDAIARVPQACEDVGNVIPSD